MVMIDQAQLLELLEAKKALDEQKRQQAQQQMTAQASTDFIGQAFSSTLFLTPPKENQTAPQKNHYNA